MSTEELHVVLSRVERVCADHIAPLCLRLPAVLHGYFDKGWLALLPDEECLTALKDQIQGDKIKNK